VRPFVSRPQRLSPAHVVPAGGTRWVYQTTSRRGRGHERWAKALNVVGMTVFICTPGDRLLRLERDGEGWSAEPALEGMSAQRVAARGAGARRHAGRWGIPERGRGREVGTHRTPRARCLLGGHQRGRRSALRRPTTGPAPSWTHTASPGTRNGRAVPTRRRVMAPPGATTAAGPAVAADTGRERRYCWALAVDRSDPERWYVSASSDSAHVQRAHPRPP
jgi:hypothetical protein